MPKAMPKVLIAAGGTAGHVVPALAVAGELRASGAEVSFVGTPDRAEAELVPAAGYEIAFLSGRGIDRRNPLSAVRALGSAAAALPRALRIIGQTRPDAVLGGGGYIAGPIGVAAALRRIPLVLTEADSHMGLANRMLAPLAKRVCLAFPIEGRDGRRYTVTGRPVPAAVLEADRDQARSRLGIAPDADCLLVFGGSLGARSINGCALEAFGAGVPGGATILHISGQRDYASLAQRLDALGDPPHYRLFEYLDTLADPLAACDLVLARAGGSVFELAAAGRPAVLVPYPHATAGHQDRNAAWMERAGAAVVIADAQLDAASLRELVAELFGDQDRLAAMSRASRDLAKPDAARSIADELISAAKHR